MKTLHIDKYTKEQAIEYADTEADIGGFARGSQKWKNAFKEYLGFAVSTISVGRNPRTVLSNPGSKHRHKMTTQLYSDVFGSNGFAGKIARKYKGQGEQPTDLSAIQNRILSSVYNLVKLFENGELGVKTTTNSDAQGRIESTQMSELQLPIRAPGTTDEEYEAQTKDVVRNWIVRDLITNAVLESLTPFFTMTKADVDEIMGAVKFQDASLEDVLAKGEREDFVKRLRAVVGPKIKQINYRKLILG